jgi:hypothetical protein
MLVARRMVLSVFLICAAAAFGERDMTVAEASGPIETALVTVAAAYAAPPSEGARESLLRAARTLADLASRMPPEHQLAVRYHQARLQAAGGDIPRALELLEGIATALPPLPEALWLKIQLAAAGLDDASNQVRWRLEDQLGLMLPLSGWGRLRDARLGEREAVRAGLPRHDVPGADVTIPAIDRARLRAVADLFAAMHMHAEAANAYRELMYSAFTPPQFPAPGLDTWISPEAADGWLTTARLEARLGRRSWAFQALLLAAASSPSALEPARAVLAALNQPPERAIVDRSKLVEIAQRYRECNLHPRALEALETARQLPGAPVAEEIKRTASEWGELLAAYREANQPVAFLFGYNLSNTPLPNVTPARFRYGTR